MLYLKMLLVQPGRYNQRVTQHFVKSQIAVSVIPLKKIKDQKYFHPFGKNLGIKRKHWCKV